MSSEPSTQGPQRFIQIGKYKVISHLATGGMGAVYKAYDTEAKRDVALKVLTPEMAANPIMIERFRREAKHAGKLRHENIVELYEFDETPEGRFFIAMEFIEGIDLSDYIDRKGMLDPEEARHIIKQAARALDHAHCRGIVHRDVKPSNFLVTRNQRGRLLVKLTDMGLSREANAEEFRVTRAGTTVGTVDYISPEQARDSGTADIRSDLYSLGCTWFHLLAGKAPFAEGGLAERLNKHLNIDPPDVRTLNRRVSRATSAVIRRLLAKRPGDRYQTPAELLKDIADLKNGGAPTGRRAMVLGLIEDDEQDLAAAQTTVMSAPKTKTAKGGGRRSSSIRSKTTDPARRKPASPPYLWYLLGGAAAALLTAVVVGLALLPHPPHGANTDRASHDSPSVLPPHVDPPPPKSDPPDKPPDKPPDIPPDKPPDKPRWAALEPTARPVDAAALRKEIDDGWTGLLERPADAPVFRVGRAPDGRPGTVYPTLAAAAAAAPADKLCVLEIDDDGPIFETSTAFTDRQLVICAGKGFRPLLVWDAARNLGKPDADRPPAFLTVERGGLRLENLDVAFQQPEALPGGVVLLDVRDADLSMEGCTCSLAGKPPEGTVLTRFHATKADAGRCRFTRCFLRGPAMTALDLDAPGAAVLFDRCLVVGGDSTLLQVRANDARPTSLTAVRSTLICGRTLLDVRQAANTDRKPAVNWFSWDSLLSRWGDRAGGDLVAAAAGPGVSTTGMKWRAYNCLYAGWRHLLTGPEIVDGAETDRWRGHWERTEGDAAIRDAWPVFNEDPSILAASAYRTADTPVAFAATVDKDQPLGCDLGALPPTRDNWTALTHESFVAPQLEPIADDGAPAINPVNDGFYHGGRIDLSQPNVEIGAILRDFQQKHLLAPRVVLLLTGTGEHAITPFHLQGCTLVLHAEAPKEDSAPLTLKWAGESSVGQEGLIEIEDGGLDMINLGLKLADFPRAAAPMFLLKVRGDLRLFRCRLEGPQQFLSDPYRGLIGLQGSGDPAPTAAAGCAIGESVLVSGRDGVQVRGVGARLLLRQSLLAAGGDALHLDPGPSGTVRTNVQCVLEHSTLAARRAILHLEDAAQQPDGLLVEPMMVRSRECAFLHPYTDKTGPAGMLVFEKSALAHGLLVWQGEGDAFSKRLTFAAAPAAALPDKEEGRPAWTRMWGSFGDRRPAADVALPKPIDAFPWALDRLALPKPKEPDKRPPGADLVALRIVKKPAKP